MSLINKIRNAKVEEEPTTLWNIPFIVVLVFGFLSGAANQMVNPNLSKYAVSLGASLSLAGTIVGLQAGMAMCLRPISGAASDLLNRKYVMLGSICITSTAYLGYLLFRNITAVIICRLLQGFSFSFMSVARTAFASAYMPKDKIGEGVAYTSFGVVLSQIVGPNIGLWVSDNFGFEYCFGTALILSLSGLAVLSLVPYKHTKGQFKKDKLKLSNLISVEVIPYALLGGMFSITTQLANSFIALVGEERGISNVAMFFTTYAVIALITRPVAGKVVDKYGLAVIMYPGFVFGALSMLFIGVAQGLPLILMSGVCKALSQGMALPSIQGSAIKRLGREKAGVASATIHMGQDLLNLVAPALGGVIASQYGYTTMYCGFAGFIILGIPIYAALRHSEKKRGIV